MLVIERRYSDHPDDIIYAVDVYLLLLEKICGFKLNEASQAAQKGVKNNQVRQIHSDNKNDPLGA